MALGATLVLPAPKSVDDGDVAVPQSSKAARVEDVDEVTEQSIAAASRYTTGGLIYPPPELRTIVDKTAQYVARNGIEFESKIRGDNAGSNRLAFLIDSDPYHAYYRAKLEALTTGQGPLAQAVDQGGDMGADAGVLQGVPGSLRDVLQKEEDERPAEPAPYQFSADLPSITALDLDIVKLTALFVAKRGRDFVTKLAAREGRSYQFEFLRPSHSLFGLFNRLVEQYRMVIEPPKDLLQQIRVGAFGTEEDVPEGTRAALGRGKGGARLKVLHDIQARVEFETWERERRKVAEDEEEKERALFDEIDWQDFVVVGTVEVTETDAHIDLPPPMSLREVRNISMAQKRMAAMIMDAEDGADGGELDALNERAAEAQAARAARREAVDEDDVEMEVESDDDTAAPVASNAGLSAPNGPMKIRKDYQPKTLAERKAAAAQQTTLCPVCGLSIALSEMDEHVRIELLNPQFREQRRELESRRAQHNALMEGADPSKFLKQFAGKRTDIFGGAAEEEAQRRRAQDEARKRKERETLVWDGHAASRTDTRADLNRADVLQQEREQITKRFKTDQPRTYLGPQMAGDGSPAEGTPPISSEYAAPVHMQGTTIQQQPSHTPMAPPVNSAPPMMGYPGDGGMGYAPPANGMYGGMQSPYGSNNGHYTGGPPPQQQQQPQLPQQPDRLDKRTDGILHPEQHWLHYHPEPLRILVQLPDNRVVSDKLDGGQVTFEGLAPSTTTIGAVRDRLQAETLNGALGASRLKLRVEGKATTLRQTLAHWNLVDGDVLTLHIS